MYSASTSEITGAAGLPVSICCSVSWLVGGGPSGEAGASSPEPSPAEPDACSAGTPTSDEALSSESSSAAASAGAAASLAAGSGGPCLPPGRKGHLSSWLLMHLPLCLYFSLQPLYLHVYMNALLQSHHSRPSSNLRGVLEKSVRRAWSREGGARYGHAQVDRIFVCTRDRLDAQFGPPAIPRLDTWQCEWRTSHHAHATLTL